MTGGVYCAASGALFQLLQVSLSHVGVKLFRCHCCSSTPDCPCLTGSRQPSYIQQTLPIYSFELDKVRDGEKWDACWEMSRLFLHPSRLSGAVLVHTFRTRNLILTKTNFQRLCNVLQLLLLARFSQRQTHAQTQTEMFAKLYSRWFYTDPAIFNK